MRIRVVVNCGAGSVDDSAADEQRGEIVDAFAAAHADAEVSFAQGPQLTEAVAAAARDEPDVVVVGGGDGTIGTAAAVLAEAHIPMAVLPLGTFNHFAKDIGMPLDMTEAADAIVHGDLSSVDLAEVNGRCFVNNSSVGVYPTMVSFRDQIRESRGWGKARAVPLAVWKVLRRLPVRRMTITADGETTQLRSPFVFVGNNSYDVGPSGVGQRTRIDAGALCLYVARADSPWKLLRIAIKAIVRGSAGVPELHERWASEVTIDVHGHRVLVSLDGESMTLRSPLRYRIRPAALTVRATPAPTAEPGSPTDPAGADAAPRR